MITFEQWWMALTTLSYYLDEW